MKKKILISVLVLFVVVVSIALYKISRNYIPDNWLFTVQDAAVAGISNKLYVYENNTYILQNSHKINNFQDWVLSKGKLNYQGNFDELMNNIREIPETAGWHIYKIELNDGTIKFTGPNKNITDIIKLVSDENIFY